MRFDGDEKTTSSPESPAMGNPNKILNKIHYITSLHYITLHPTLHYITLHCNYTLNCPPCATLCPAQGFLCCVVSGSALWLGALQVGSCNSDRKPCSFDKEPCNFGRDPTILEVILFSEILLLLAV